MSTALISSNQPSKQPVEVVVILRFLLGVRRRCAVNVSTVDTAGAPQLFRELAVAPGETGPILEPHASRRLRRYDALNRELRFPPRTSLSSR